MDTTEEIALDFVLSNIKSAIKEENIEKLSTSLEQIQKKTLQKDIAKIAIDSHNDLIVELVLEKTIPKCIDSEIITMSIKTQNRDIVRLVADKIDDRTVFEANKEKIQNAILDGNDIKSITGQILNISDNESYDCEMQEIVMQMYLDIVSNHFKKSNLPPNFPMKQFSESMKESIFFLAAPECINLDGLNDKNRFLLLPVYAQHHAFSAYARKLDVDKYSIAFVNLGVTDSERAKGIEPYTEFVYTKDCTKKVLDMFCLKARTEFLEKDRVVDSKFAYHTFKYFSKEKHFINVHSREQKVGNCFLKNMEKGIRYALSMELSKANDSSFVPESLRISSESLATQSNSEKNKVKFLNPFFKTGTKNNSFPTIQLKIDLVNWLTNNFGQYESEINEEWNSYKSHKENSFSHSNNRTISNSDNTENVSPHNKSNKKASKRNEKKNFEM